MFKLHLRLLSVVSRSRWIAYLASTTYLSVLFGAFGYLEVLFDALGTFLYLTKKLFGTLGLWCSSYGCCLMQAMDCISRLYNILGDGFRNIFLLLVGTFCCFFVLFWYFKSCGVQATPAVSCRRWIAYLVSQTIN